VIELSINALVDSEKNTPMKEMDVDRVNCPPDWQECMQAEADDQKSRGDGCFDLDSQTEC
jgi:hypothetical protein